MFLPTARFGAISFALAFASAALAQPETESTIVTPAPAPATRKTEPFVRVDVLVPESGPVLLGVRASNSDAGQVLLAISQRANIQVILKTGVRASIEKLKLEPCAPDAAIKAVCDAAKLSCEKRDGVWLISPVQANVPTKPVTLDLSFSDIETARVLGLIEARFGLKMRVDPPIFSTIPLISLNERTPRDAVDLIAEAADLEVCEENGTLFIRAKPRL